MEQEIWKAIPKFENRYEVSDLGRIRNIKKGNILKPFDRLLKSKGIKSYLSVRFVLNGHTRNYTVHSLVMRCFKGPKPKHSVIHHKDFDTYNNRFLNLMYCTQKYNKQQDFLNGQSFKGEKNNRALLTEENVLEIVRQRRQDKIKYQTLADKYKVSFNAIANIFTGHTWAYLTGIKSKKQKQ